MALIKSITLANGVNVNYHRIVSVNNITNLESVIELASYTSKEKRQEEKTAIQNHQSMNVFINTKYMSVTYNPSLNVNTAYSYLKTLEQFSGYTDDID